MFRQAADMVVSYNNQNKSCAAMSPLTSYMAISSMLCSYAKGVPTLQQYADVACSNEYSSGQYDSGYYNSGQYDSGYIYSGYYSSGHYDSGYNYSGYYDSGHYDSGHYGSGYNYSGYYDSGHYDSGYYYSGHYDASGYESMRQVGLYGMLAKMSVDPHVPADIRDAFCDDECLHAALARVESVESKFPRLSSLDRVAVHAASIRRACSRGTPDNRALLTESEKSTQGGAYCQTLWHRARQNEQVSELMARFRFVCQDPVTSSYDSCPSQCRELMLEVMSYMGCCSFETLPQNAKCGVFCLAASCNLSSVGEC